jgi:hypothetical protein
MADTTDKKAASGDPVFDVQKIDQMLEPPRWDGDFYMKLEAARDYFEACSRCVYPDLVQIVDSQGLLKRFEEVYLAVYALVKDIAPDLAERLQQLESRLNLSQNVVRLSVVATVELVPPGMLAKLGMRFFGVAINVSNVALTLPDEQKQKPSQELLLDVQVALRRLAGLAGAGSRRAKEYWLSNEDVLVVDGFYDPRKVAKNTVVIYLTQALRDIESNTSIPGPVVKALQAELGSVIEELGRQKTPWNKVLSRLSQVALLLAALVSASADVDKAYQNVLNALNSISRQAVPIHVPPQQPQDFLDFARKYVALPAGRSAHLDTSEDEEGSE